ncbi:unnamed protein product [Blepharisma stoltei]|nr:unnamed protein product [Blepharisma stoltei]
MTIETTSIETRANLVFYLTPAPTSFIPEDNITIENNNYRLYGVICHIGTNLSGHYFAYTYCEAENSWVEYNDSMVSFADKPNFRCAYMLFYKNKN